VKNLPLKIDFHVHTCYSHDGITTPKQLIAYAKRRGLDGVAITDHDTIDGAVKLAKKKTGLLIIPGVEVTTKQGHVIALNVTIPIPSQRNVKETAEKIHEAGGIAVASHPAALTKQSLMENVTSAFDAIEVINSSALPFFFSVYFSRKIATRLKLPQIAGSDSHYAPEIGTAYTIVDADPDVDEVIKAIRASATKPFGKWIPLNIRLKREALILKKKWES